MYFFFSTSRVWVTCIELYNWGRFRVISLILYLPQLFLLLIFILFFWGLRTFQVVVWVCNLEFLGLELGFFVPGVFYWVFSKLNINCCGVDQIIVLLGPIDYFLDLKDRLEAQFYLSFNCFFNNLFLCIKLLPFCSVYALIEGFKLFSESW